MLEKKLDAKEYKKEVAIIKQITKLGLTETQIYGAWNYYTSKGQKFDSFAIFLWKKAKLVYDVLPLLAIKVEEKPKLHDADYRTETHVPLPKKPKLKDFLS